MYNLTKNYTWKIIALEFAIVLLFLSKPSSKSSFMMFESTVINSLYFVIALHLMKYMFVHSFLFCTIQSLPWEFL